MTQQSKKISHGHVSAKTASSAANRASRDGFSAVESTRSSAENVVKIGSAAMKEFMASSADEAQKAQSKMLTMSRENAEHLAKSAGTLSKTMSEMSALSRDVAEACVECSNLTVALAQDVGSEIFEAANQAFSDHVEISKEFFACRTINDMFDLQSRAAKSMLDSFFSESQKLSGMVMEYSSEALEPIGERVAKATEKLSKVIAV